MFRLFFGIFLGYYRGGSYVAPAHSPEEEENDEEEVGGGHHGGPVGYYNIYEVPGVMSFPLIVLAVLSVIGGFVGSFALFGMHNWQPLADFLHPIYSTTPGLSHEAAPSLMIEWISTGLALLAGVLGILIAWARYRKGFVYQESKNPLYLLLFNKYYVDEALSFLIVKPITASGRFVGTHFLEGAVLDGGSRGIAWILRSSSSALGRLQTGYMRNYALAIMFGVIVIIVYYAVRG
jgi:NADH-quinone oxidoreductase subunit L